MPQLRERIRLVTTLEAIWPFVRPSQRALAQAAAATILLTAVDISIPLLSRAYLDWITGDLRHYEATLPTWIPHLIIALLLVGAFTRGGLLTWQRSLVGRIGERTAGRVRSKLWSHVQELPVDQTQRRGPGRLLVRFVSDIKAVQRLVTDVLLQGGQDLFVIAAVLVILALLNWWMALPAILLVPTYGLIFRFLNPRLRRHTRAARRRRTRLSAFLNERIVGMKVVKAQVQERTEATRVRGMTRDLARRGARLAAAAATLQGVAAAAVTCSMALTLALAPREIAAGRVTSGTLVAFIMLLGLLAPALRRIARLNRTVQEAHVSVSRLKLALAQDREEGSDRAARRLRVRQGDLKVRRVSFAGGDGTLVLNRVSLEAHRGELVALVGPNGSGKSTLLDLVLRFKEPTAGRIVIDGRRIENVSLSSLRAQIGWVPQEAVLFDATLRENITYGARRPPAREAVRRAIRLADLDKIAARLPEGLNTRVGPGGQLLSPGERQRVALARALVADPPILVLDDLLSAVDAAADQALARVLRGLAREKTVIVVTHLLPILLAADRVYVLRRGRLIARGSHAELLRGGSPYAQLVGTRPMRHPKPPERPDATPSPTATDESGYLTGTRHR